jgi:hypothetical protein
MGDLVIQFSQAPDGLGERLRPVRRDDMAGVVLVVVVVRARGTPPAATRDREHTGGRDGHAVREPRKPGCRLHASPFLYQ